jgi:hypothetical protein
VWQGVRERVARLLGRGTPDGERAVLERLDRTGRALEAAPPEERAAVADRQEASWQTRLEDFLEGLDATDQAAAVAQLHALLEALRAATEPAAAVHADHSGVTAGGDIANHGGVIGRDFDGPVTIGSTDRPTGPGADPR